MSEKDALKEMALVLCSITLLTRQRFLVRGNSSGRPGPGHVGDRVLD